MAYRATVVKGRYRLPRRFPVEEHHPARLRREASKKTRGGEALSLSPTSSGLSASLTLWRYNWQNFHVLALDFPPGRHLSTGDLTVLVYEIKTARAGHLTLTAPVLPWKQPQPEVSLFEFLD